MLLFALIVSPILLYFIYSLWSRRKLYALARKLDGLSEKFPDYPLFGGTLKIVGKTTKESLHMGIDFCKTVRSPGKFWFGPSLLLVVDQPEDIQLILNSPNCLAKPYVFRFFNIGKGLLAARLKLWKVHRKLLNPSFNMKILKKSIAVFNEKSLILADRIGDCVGKEEFDIFEYIGRCTLDMVSATTLGANLHIQDEGYIYGQNFMNGFKRYGELVTQRILNIWHYFDFIYKRSDSYKELIHSMNLCWEMADKIIAVKNEAMAKEGSYESEEFNKPEIFINQLFKLSKEDPQTFDSQAIRDEVFTSIFGGYETSALTLSNAIVLMAIYQDVQDKVAAELNEVFYDINEVPDYDILTKLVYTEMVLKETMRLYPISPFLTRVTTKDIVLATKPIEVPSIVTLVMPVYTVHRDPKIWGPNADSFDPENFSRENNNKRHPYAYLPFSGGSRSCIGNKYAMISMRLILANLLRKYKFSTKLTMDTIDIKYDITLKFDQKHIVTVERRV